MAKTEKKPPTSLETPGRIAWAPPKIADHVPEIYALQALAGGRASEHQQQLALKFIIEVLAQTYGWAYRPESERETLVMLGRQFVGTHLVSFINANLAKFRNPHDDTEQGR